MINLDLWFGDFHEWRLGLGHRLQLQRVFSLTGCDFTHLLQYVATVKLLFDYFVETFALEQSRHYFHEFGLIMILLLILPLVDRLRTLFNMVSRRRFYLL